jgi:hypothetical protein
MAGIAITAEHIAQLLARMPRGIDGGTKKLETLSSTNGSEWRTWRNHFQTVAVINEWDDERSRRELKAAMNGDASRLTNDIPIALHGIQAVLQNYQNRFQPPAAGQIARVEFHAAKQRPDERVTQFHGRLREMFFRAYPNENAENSMQLIQAFTLGLLDTEVSRFVLDRAPDTFTAASNLASTKDATEAALLHRVGRGKGVIHSIQSGNQCWYCGADGHRRDECPAYQLAKRYFTEHPVAQIGNGDVSISQEGRRGGRGRAESDLGNARRSERTPRSGGWISSREAPENSNGRRK